MTDELKPCPFCLSHIAPVPTVHKSTGWWYVVCRECDTEGPSDLGKSGAIERWNTRPLEAQLLEACKAANNAILSHTYIFNQSDDLYQQWSSINTILDAAIRAAKGTQE